jgi:hypothetical protein
MPGGLTLLAATPSSIPNPPANKVTIFFNTTANAPYYKDSFGNLFPLTGSIGQSGSFIAGADGEDGVDGISIPGPQGATGATGATGNTPILPTLFFDGNDGEDGLPGPPGIAGTGGGGGGALTLVEEHTASSSAALTFTTGITATYDDYMISIVDLVVATNNVSLYLENSANGGSTWNPSTNNYTAFTGLFNGGTAVSNFTNPPAIITLATGLSNAVNRPIQAKLFANSFASIVLDKHIYGTIVFSNQANVGVATFFSLLDDASTAYNAFRIRASAGNLASGTVRLYGLSH